MRLELSADADADLDELLRYGVERWGYEIGREYFFSFDDSFDLLRRHPEAGTPRDDIEPGVRGLTHRRHKVFYELRADHMLVLRILHHAMDVSRRLRQRD